MDDKGFPETAAIGDLHHVHDENGDLQSYIYSGSGWIGVSPTDKSSVSMYSSSTTTATSSSSGAGGVTGTSGVMGIGGGGGYYTTTPYTYPSTTTTMTFPSTTVYTSLFPSSDKNPFDEMFNGDNIVPDRDVFIAQEMYKHVSSANATSSGSDVTVTCGCKTAFKSQTDFVLHLSKIAIESADKWDQLIMDGDDLLDNEV